MPKVKRQKHVRKCLTFYQNSFGVKAPYNILIDGTFCKAALRFKVNISDQMPKYLDAEAKLCTTKCVLAECEAMGSLLYGPLKILQQFEVEPCKHRRLPFPAYKCLAKKARKKDDKKYFIATQDRELSDVIREIPGTPLLYIAHTAINLEAPAKLSQMAAKGVLDEKLAPSKIQQETLKAIKKEVFGEEPERKKRKRKGPKGANPLSCKKKKKATKIPGSNTGTVNNANKSKRSRKKKKTTIHNINSDNNNTLHTIASSR